MKRRKNLLKSIDQIAETIKPMRDTPDGSGRSLITQNSESIFEQAKEVLDARKSQGMDERFNKAVLEALYETLKNLIPIAERQYKRYPGDRFAAMSFNTVTNQMREVLNDIRSIQSFEGQSDRITRTNSLQFQMMLQNFADEIYKIKKIVGASVPRDRADVIDRQLGQSLESHGLYLKESLKLINDKVTEQLVKK